MPLNPKRAFNAMLVGPLRPNDDGMWAIYEGDEELTYWDEGQQMEVQRGEDWLRGVVAWDGEAYVLELPTGELFALAPGMSARRRVGGSI